MKKKRWFIAAALAASVGLALNLKSEPLSHEIEEDGYVKDNSNPSAPKAIKSRKITAFYTSFFCECPDEPACTGRFWFEIEKNDTGVLMLTASCALKSGVAADEALLEEIQNIIERNDLVKLNGLDCVTQALPVQYSPCSLSVSYSSGEKLYFRTDGEPDSRWYKDYLNLFLPLIE